MPMTNQRDSCCCKHMMRASHPEEPDVLGQEARTRSRAHWKASGQHILSPEKCESRQPSIYTVASPGIRMGRMETSLPKLSTWHDDATMRWLHRVYGTIQSSTAGCKNHHCMMTSCIATRAPQWKHAAGRRKRLCQSLDLGQVSAHKRHHQCEPRGFDSSRMVLHRSGSRRLIRHHHHPTRATSWCLLTRPRCNGLLMRGAR